MRVEEYCKTHTQDAAPPFQEFYDVQVVPCGGLFTTIILCIALRTERNSLSDPCPCFLMCSTLLSDANRRLVCDTGSTNTKARPEIAPMHELIGGIAVVWTRQISHRFLLPRRRRRRRERQRCLQCPARCARAAPHRRQRLRSRCQHNASQ
jgi:hypothetical protein